MSKLLSDFGIFGPTPLTHDILFQYAIPLSRRRDEVVVGVKPYFRYHSCNLWGGGVSKECVPRFVHFWLYIRQISRVALRATNAGGFAVVPRAVFSRTLVSTFSGQRNLLLGTRGFVIVTSLNITHKTSFPLRGRNMVAQIPGRAGRGFVLYC